MTNFRHALRRARGGSVLVIMLACAVLAGPAARADVLLSTTVVRHSTVLDANEMFGIYAPYIGKAVTATTAEEIAAAVRERYRVDGYSRPGYAVQDDGRLSGIVRIDLVEAVVTGVEISGTAGPHSERLGSLFEGVTPDRVLRPADMRALLQRARRLPGLDVNVSTRPDAGQAGGYVLQVESDFDPLAGSLTLTNRGTEQIGRNIALAQLVAQGVFNGDGSIGLLAGSAEDSSVYSSAGIFYKTVALRSNTAVSVKGSVAALSFESDGVLVDQDRQRYRLDVSRPLPEWRKRTMLFKAALESDSFDIRHDSARVRKQHLYNLAGGATMNWRGSRRQHLLSFDVEFGLDDTVDYGDGTTPPDDRSGHYFIGRGHYADLLPLNASWSMRWDLYAQVSPDSLPSIKQFKVGGGRVGRGFEAAALSGDHGLGGKVDLRRRLRSGGALGPVDTYVFYDLGAAWQHDGAGRESAATSGIGLSVGGTYFAGYIELAKPLTHADADGQRDLGVFVEMTGRF